MASAIRPSARAHLASLVAGLAVGAVLLGSCSSEPPDPAEQRRDRVAERLEETFSRQQASCIVDRLDDDVIAALDAEDATAPLDAESSELLAYTDALLACVAGEDAVPDRGE
jgi:glycogen debranching enzyme